MDDEQRAARAQIQAALEKTGLSPTELARRAGVAGTTLTRFLNSSDVKHVPSTRTLSKILAAAGMHGLGVNDGLAGRVKELPHRIDMPRDVPVMGTAMAANGDGAFLLNTGEPIDWARRGPGIAKNKHVFTIYVEGESMEPRFEPGELIYLDPTRPVKLGDDVVVVFGSMREGQPDRHYLKRLVRRTAEKVLTRQFNPDEVVEFPAGSVKQIIRVLRMNEVMGL